SNTYASILVVTYLPRYIIKLTIHHVSHTDSFSPAHLNRLLIHVPHSSTYLPENTGFHLERAMTQIALGTDWAIERLFAIAKVKMLVAPFSRIFCDVERLSDEDEPMFMKGQGIAYTLD